MTDPIFILLLFIVAPASICITFILGYLAFLQITKRYAVQASNNVFDRLFDMLERKLPDILEKLLLSRAETVPPINQENLTQRISEGRELLTKFLGALDIGGNMGVDASPVDPNLHRRTGDDTQQQSRYRSGRHIIDLE